MTYTIYRLWDEAGNLLYVGQTNDELRRLDEHVADKQWLPERFTVTLERGYHTREAVSVAEENAIKDERPRHNVLHNKMRTAREKVLAVLWWHLEAGLTHVELIAALFGRGHETIDGVRVLLAIQELQAEGLIESRSITRVAGEVDTTHKITAAGAAELINLARGVI